MERCPICRARLHAQSPCPRCGSDLSLPLQIAHRARLLEQDAVARLAAGEMDRVEAALLEASSLQSTPLARVLLGFVREHRKSCSAQRMTDQAVGAGLTSDQGA